MQGTSFSPTLLCRGCHVSMARLRQKPDADCGCSYWLREIIKIQPVGEYTFGNFYSCGMLWIPLQGKQKTKKDTALTVFTSLRLELLTSFRHEKRLFIEGENVKDVCRNGTGGTSYVVVHVCKSIKFQKSTEQGIWIALPTQFTT